MHAGILFSLIGFICMCIGISMFAPILISLYFREGNPYVFLIPSLASIAIGGGLFLLFKGEKENISHKESFLMVTLGWTISILIGAIPYYLDGSMGGLVNAIFESASGFTTTGATILESVNGMPKGLLLWRSMTHWFGGMGIIVLALAIFPILGVGGMQLYRREVPGPVHDKIKPRVAETAKGLWKIYILITSFEIVLLIIGGMEIFDAFCHSFSTVATGGFSTEAKSIEAFDSPYIEIIITLFMLIAGLNFSIHYRAFRGEPLSYWRNSECRFFFFIFLISTLIVTIDLIINARSGIWQSIRYASFQVASILTTTGFTTVDYEKWPQLSHSIIFFLMFIGGCAGSTGGAMKCIRVLILIKSAYTELYRIFHPHGVITLKVGGRLIPRDVIDSILGFTVLYMLIFVVASLLLGLIGLDMITAFSSVASCIGNVGPGLGKVGPSENYNQIPQAGKLILSICMVIGRLEIYTVISLFIPEFWRK